MEFTMICDPPQNRVNFPYEIWKPDSWGQKLMTKGQSIFHAFSSKTSSKHKQPCKVKGVIIFLQKETWREVKKHYMLMKQLEGKIGWIHFWGEHLYYIHLHYHKVFLLITYLFRKFICIGVINWKCQSMRFSNWGNVNVRMPIHTSNPEFNIFTQTFFSFSRQPKSECY